MGHAEVLYTYCRAKRELNIIATLGLSDRRYKLICDYFGCIIKTGAEAQPYVQDLITLVCELAGVNVGFIGEKLHNLYQDMLTQSQTHNIHIEPDYTAKFDSTYKY